MDNTNTFDKISEKDGKMKSIPIITLKRDQTLLF